jgi:hypothetical protein
MNGGLYQTAIPTPTLELSKPQSQNIPRRKMVVTAYSPGRVELVLAPNPNASQTDRQTLWSHRNSGQTSTRRATRGYTRTWGEGLDGASFTGGSWGIAK